MKKQLLWLSIAATLSLSIALPACADKDTASKDVASDEKTSQALVEKVAEDRLTLLSTFKGPGDLIGYVMKPKQGGSPVILYAQNQGHYAVYGTVIGPNGENLSEQYQEKYINAYTADLIAAQLPKAATFSEGAADAPYQLYVLADPSCSACHYFYQNVKEQIKNGQLRIQWILVGFVQAESLAQAASIMSDKDPGNAMANNEDGFDAEHEMGGAKPMETIPAELQAKLDANMAFMHDTGLSSTPTLIFYDKNGKLSFIQGAPRDISAFLQQSAPKVTK